jgi:hypothetical protein
MRARGTELHDAIWLQGKPRITSAREGLLVYDFASLCEVAELEVLDAESIFQNCAIILLSAEFDRKDISVGYCCCDDQLRWI